MAKDMKQTKKKAYRKPEVKSARIFERLALDCTLADESCIVPPFGGKIGSG